MATPGPTESEQLVFADAAAWRAWLDEYEENSDGIWLVIAKKGVTDPTSLTYAQALDEALCSGWIDGQARSRDQDTYIQRFTPRRKRSLWSLRNVDYVARLTAEGRMRARGQAEIDRAKQDGRWERAYPGSAAAEPPDYLIAALSASPPALAAFEALNSTERFVIIFQLTTAASEKTRQARLERTVAKLSTA